MYTYLNQRYGLKSLIVEWAAAIINGVKTYVREDHDVSLFAKILKNECDESFRFIQAHVKETLIALVKTMLKEKYQHKTESDIQKMLDNVQKGRIEESMWIKIIEKMYDESDQMLLEEAMRSCIQMRAELPQSQ